MTFPTCVGRSMIVRLEINESGPKRGGLRMAGRGLPESVCTGQGIADGVGVRPHLRASPKSGLASPWWASRVQLYAGWLAGGASICLGEGLRVLRQRIILGPLLDALSTSAKTHTPGWAVHGVACTRKSDALPASPANGAIWTGHRPVTQVNLGIGLAERVASRSVGFGYNRDALAHCRMWRVFGRVCSVTDQTRPAAR